MPSFIAKQPNGLYCRFSTVVDCPTDINMTEEDYIERCKKNAEMKAIDTLENDLVDFSEIINRYLPNNMTQEEFDKIVDKMCEIGNPPCEIL